MATVRLTDAIIPEVYMSYTAVDSPELTAFYQSGVVVRNDMLDQLANGGGEVINVPYWKDLDANVEPNYTNDDPTDLAVPNKIGSDKMAARTAQLNQAYSAMDLTSELAGSDPMQRIRDRFGSYWTKQWQRRIIAACKGVYADNVANEAGDMVNDISIADGLAADDSNLFGRKAFTGAVFTLGDHFSALQAIAVHSLVYKRMVDNDDIEFIKDSAGELSIPTFMGKMVIVDDSLPVVAGGVSGYKFTSILFGSGAIGYGEGAAKVPVEVWRNPAAGKGGGEEQIWERKTWLVHVLGYKWNETTLTAQSPKLADLALAVNWTRKYDRKQVPLAFLVTNG